MNGSRPSASRRSSSRRIFRRLVETNSVKTPDCGLDDYCETAREKIRRACRAPDAEVFFLVGGTQTNATVLDAVLQSYQGLVDHDGGSGSAVRRAVTARSRRAVTHVTALRL